MITEPEKKSPDGGQANRDKVTVDQQSKSLTNNTPANDNGQAREVTSRSVSARPITLVGLMAAEIPLRNYIVNPIIREKDMVKIVAATGVGKTTFWKMQTGNMLPQCCPTRKI